jgi:hypothetical protein
LFVGCSMLNMIVQLQTVRAVICSPWYNFRWFSTSNSDKLHRLFSLFAKQTSTFIRFSSNIDWERETFVRCRLSSSHGATQIQSNKLSSEHLRPQRQIYARRFSCTLSSLFLLVRNWLAIFAKINLIFLHQSTRKFSAHTWLRLGVGRGESLQAFATISAPD